MVRTTLVWIVAGGESDTSHRRPTLTAPKHPPVNKVAELLVPKASLVKPCYQVPIQPVALRCSCCRHEATPTIADVNILSSYWNNLIN